MEFNRTYNENCLVTMSKMSQIIDMTLTSPPYDDLRKYGGYVFEFEPIAKELFRITKEGGVLLWVVADQTKKGSESGTAMRQALFFLQLGFRLHDTMIYAKKNFIPLTHNRYEQGWEYMFCFSKGKPRVFNGIRIPSITAGDKYNYSKKGSNVREGGYRRRNETVETKPTKLHTNIFTYSTGDSRTKCAAPFPKQLVRDQINTWTNKGDIVYDPFHGSGTTGLIAKELERRFIASELNPVDCEFANQRIK